MMAPRSWMILWIVGTVGGSFFGPLAIICVATLLPLRDAVAFVVATAIVAGCIGFGQWTIALRGIVNGVAWTIATLAVGILVPIGLVFAADLPLLSPILNSNFLHETWIGGVFVPGLIISVCAALPTSIVLSRYTSQLYVWILGCVVTSFTAVLAFITIALFDEIYVGLLCFVLVMPVIGAIVSAPFIWFALSSPRSLVKMVVAQ